MALKNKDLTTIFAVMAIAVLTFGFLTSWTFNFADVNLPSLPSPSPGQQGVDPADLTSATKPLKVVLVDELAGGNPDGTIMYVYDTNGKTKLETLTLSSGSATTANSYSSGRALVFQYYYDTTIDAYKFWPVTVPQMTRADAESLTTNSLTLKTREAGAYTDSLITSSGITITDGLAFNVTGSSNDTGTMTYSLYTTSDNTGYPSFHDTAYEVDLKPVVWATLSGTGYDTVSLSGFDGAFEKGSTMYYYKVISDDAISKYKVGNNYVLPGASSVSFSWNCVGYANTTTSNPTLQLYTEIYSSPTYMQQFGAYGPYPFAATEQTMTFYTN